MPIAISTHNVTLDLPVHTMSRRPGIRKVIVKDVGGRLEQSDRKHTWVRALHKVSFEINRGERVGLIGHNGAGKSSLLRVIAGIYPPSHGVVRVRGRVSTLFSSTIGFNLNATGWENIILMGVLLGVGRKRIEALSPEIAGFSELGEFLDMPVRAYSVGMRTRLGFAIATSIEPECLLIDEVLGAGDNRFQKKARERLTNLMDGAYTLILASHSMNTIRSFCDRALWLEHGRLRMAGAAPEVTQAFVEDQGPTAADDPADAGEPDTTGA